MANAEHKSDPGDDNRAQRRVDSRIAALASKQFGVISRGQLEALGLSPVEVRGRCQRGALHCLHHGVYAVGHCKLTGYARLLAAQLSCGPDSFLSHRTSAAAHGLRVIAVSHIEVTVPAGHALNRPGLIMHRTSKPPHKDDVVTRDGLRTSSIPRMLIELAPRETPEELDRLITEAVRKGLFDVDKMTAALARHAGWPGIRKLRHALRHYVPKHERKSGLERAFDRLIAGTDIPEPQRNIRLYGWEIDCYWPEQRLAVELDGRPYHIAIKDIEKDKVKDAKLMRRDIKPMRVTDWRMESDAKGVLDDVRALLGLL